MFTKHSNYFTIFFHFITQYDCIFEFEYTENHFILQVENSIMTKPTFDINIFSVVLCHWTVCVFLFSVHRDQVYLVSLRESYRNEIIPYRVRFLLKAALSIHAEKKGSIETIEKEFITNQKGYNMWECQREHCVCLHLMLHLGFYRSSHGDRVKLTRRCVPWGENTEYVLKTCLFAHFTWYTVTWIGT